MLAKINYAKIATLMFSLVFIFTVTRASFIGTYQIRNFSFIRCPDTDDDPISLDNVSITIGNELTPVVTGIFTTKIDLDAPIKVSTIMKRHLFIWIELPCINDMGSCTYDDVCKFGRPDNEECPEIFKENNLPCRCPIKKGTYVIPPRLNNFFADSSVYTGTYKATTTISSGDKRLACYNSRFTIYDEF